jgi:hypothetical protein
VIALILRDVKAVEHIWKEYRQVLVAPSSVFHIRSNACQVLLESQVRLVIAPRRDGRYGVDGGQELIAMAARDFNGFCDRNVFRGATRSLFCPRSRLGAAIHPELKSAPTGYAAEYARKNLIVLEFKPVHQAVLRSMRVHALQQFLPVKRSQYLWTELSSKGVVVTLKSGGRWQCTVGRQRAIKVS